MTRTDDPTLGASDTSPSTRYGDDQVMAGHYALGVMLGRGGMADVLLAHDPKMGRDIALKRMRAEPTHDTIEQFLREAKIQAHLDHPAIVPVHDLGYDSNGFPYFTMKRLAGTTLAALIDEGAAPLKLLRALVDVCLAIELAHSRGIIHRDLKPSNIMLGDFGEVYVLDWGIAHVLSEPNAPAHASGPALESHTSDGLLLGTPGYMAPEQMRGEEVGPLVDVYALGSILFEILTSQPLHPRGIGALASTLEGLADLSPSRRAPERGIAPELDVVCVAALGEASIRPTARMLADKIQAYLDGDRDLAQRRALAEVQLVIARAALASRDPARRGDAVLAAGRALAFDPMSTEALDLVTSLIVVAPASEQLPAEVSEAFHDEEMRLTRERSRRGFLPVLSFFLFIPFIVAFGVVNWVPLVGVCVAITALASVSYINWRIRYLPSWVFLITHLVVVTMFTRVTSVFLVSPMMIVGMLLASTSMPWIIDRKWVVAAWTLLAVFAPFILEWTGVFASTWTMTPAGVLSHPSLFSAGLEFERFLIVTANALIALMIGLFALGIARDRRDAQRRLHEQSWHLHQLLPRQVVAPGGSDDARYARRRARR